MKIGVIVQARMSSERLPGKVLMKMEGKPVLQYVVERLQYSKAVGGIVVATSEETGDEPIVQFCKRLEIPCYRGSHNDVAGRFAGVLDKYDWEAFVRVCGDSPLLDQYLIDRAVGVFRESNCDLVTNVWPRSYPYGQSVEVLGTGVFRRAYEQMQELEDKEHVTRFFYQHEQEFSIRNFTSKANYAGLHMAADTKDDFEVIEMLIGRMSKSHWEYTVDEMVGMMELARL